MDTGATVCVKVYRTCSVLIWDEEVSVDFFFALKSCSLKTEKVSGVSLKVTYLRCHLLNATKPHCPGNDVRVSFPKMIALCNAFVLKGTWPICSCVEQDWRNDPSTLPIQGDARVIQNVPSDTWLTLRKQIV